VARRTAAPASCILLPAAVCVAILLGVSSPVDAQASKEYLVKAAFLLKLTKYVEWPNSNEPFSIGILGDDPFGTVLDELVKGETVHKRPMVVKRSRRVEDLKSCEVLFICRSESNAIPQIMRDLTQSRTLIVGDVEGFCRNGGIVNLIIQNGRLSFEINPRAAKKHGIGVDSQVLSLAKIVDSDPG
jgi:hypothetical protein